MAKKGKKARPQKKKANGYKMPPPIPPGEVIEYNNRKWMIGPSIGVGGFGEIYSACEYREGESTSSDASDYPYVVKIEPEENGPLFVEMHFYNRNSDRNDIQQFMKSRNLSQLGMPTYCGSSLHKFQDEVLRFLIVERYGTDLWKTFKEVGRRFPVDTVFQLGLQMLDVLDYIHSRSYIHADIKGANILMGIKEGTENQAYLLDFGLAYRIVDDNYKPDPKSAHEGTIEYISTDRHIGAKTMRGDLEILGYNLLQWLIGELPWEKEKVLENPKKVHKMKTDLMNNIRTRITTDYPHVPEELIKFFEYIKTLEPKDKPDYTICREIFESFLTSVGKTRTSQLEFTATKNNEQSITPDAWPLSSNGNNSKISETDSQNKLIENQDEIFAKNKNENKNKRDNDYKITPAAKDDNESEQSDNFRKQKVTKNKKKKNKRGKETKGTASVENEMETEQSQDDQDLKITKTKKNKKKKDEISENVLPVEDYAESENADDVQEQNVTKKKKNKKDKDTVLAENEIESEQPDDNQELKIAKTKKKKAKALECTSVKNDAESEHDGDKPEHKVTKHKKNKRNRKTENTASAENDVESEQPDDIQEQQVTRSKKKRKNENLEEIDAANEQFDDNQDQRVAKNKKKRNKKTEDTPPAENNPDNQQSDDNQDQQVAKRKRDKKQKAKETEDAMEDDNQKHHSKKKKRYSKPTISKPKSSKKRKAPTVYDSEIEFLGTVAKKKKRYQNESYTTTQLYAAKLPVKSVEIERPFLAKSLRSENKITRTDYYKAYNLTTKTKQNK